MNKSCKWNNCSASAREEFYSSKDASIAPSGRFTYVYFCSNKHREKWNLKMYDDVAHTE